MIIDCEINDTTTFDKPTLQLLDDNAFIVSILEQWLSERSSTYNRREEKFSCIFQRDVRQLTHHIQGKLARVGGTRTRPAPHFPGGFPSNLPHTPLHLEFVIPTYFIFQKTCYNTKMDEISKWRLSTLVMNKNKSEVADRSCTGGEFDNGEYTIKGHLWRVIYSPVVTCPLHQS